MLFNSSQYLLFLPLVVMAYFLIPHRFRWILLLAASYYFYACWRLEYLFLIAGTTLIDYGMGLAIARTTQRPRRLLFLCTSLTINLTLLFVFKYFDFFSHSIRAAFDAVNVTIAAPELNLLLPVGISFYTFQSIAYVVEVYRGKVQPERHLGLFAAYISFFPQLVAGPIERPYHLLPQFHERHRPDFQRMTRALNLIALGFFKKVVIADRCAVYVEEVFSLSAEWGFWATALGVVLFAFQIYCDFSGYSDIAIGSARLMGFDLMQNFDRPYRARSISEFWRRWHISLSTWFRDYVYLPLGGNRRSPLRNHLNVMLTFLASGLWHGANWTFVIWGAFHGALLVCERQLGWDKKAAKPTFRFSFFTFPLVCIGWIFFRSENMAMVGHIFRNLVDFSQGPASMVIRSSTNALGSGSFAVLCFCMALFFLSGLLPRDLKLRYNLLYLVLISLVILFLGKNTGNEFIYFQF
jgi:alginate O-acetyltransferase complex protein AlgI